MTSPPDLLRQLGERVARAYGWQRGGADCGPETWWKQCGAGIKSLRSTPDPENSWEDFGALLEWVRELPKDKMFCDAMIVIKSEWGKGIQRGQTWPAIRRAVTEAILGVIEHD